MSKGKDEEVKSNNMGSVPSNHNKMTETVHISRDIHPKAKLPEDRQTPVWRYMDRWKFEALITQQKLYLCRADKLQDRFEGNYSRDQLLDMNHWLTVKGYESIINDEKKDRQVNRQRFYISSWCMYPYDLDIIVTLGEWEKNPRLQAKTLVCLRYGALQKKQSYCL